MIARKVAMEAKPEEKRPLGKLGVDGKIMFNIIYHLKKETFSGEFLSLKTYVTVGVLHENSKVEHAMPCDNK